MIKRGQTVAVLLGLAGLQTAWAEQTVLWTTAGDELNFNDVGVALDPVPGTLTGAGAGILDSSPIGDGDALVLWDLDTAGRIDLRYETSEPAVGLHQYRFHAYIESGSTGGNATLFRIGNGGLVNSVGNAALSIALEHDGDLRFEYNDGSGGRIGTNHPVGLDTAFEVSVVFNATAAEAQYDGPEGLKLLAAGHYDIYVDNTLVGNDLPALSGYSGTGITRMWFLSGTGSSAVAPTVHLDNIIIYSDDSVSVPPDDVETFWGRTVTDGYIDSGTWLGWLYVDSAPWIYSAVLDKWIYCTVGPDEDVSAGAWAYFLR